MFYIKEIIILTLFNTGLLFFSLIFGGLHIIQRCKIDNSRLNKAVSDNVKA